MDLTLFAKYLTTGGARKADHLAAPMPGEVSSRDATIADVHVEAGTVVEARDRLVVLKT